MRTLLLKEKKADAADFEASRAIMEGWYGGKPKGEHSAAYQIIYKGPESAPRGEKTEKQFKEAMRHLASGVSALLCQDEVLVVFDVPEGKFTESYSGGAKDRQRADVLRTGEGFEGVEPTVLEEAQALADRINKEGVGLPVTRAQVSTLGGKHRPSVSVSLSFDPRETWSNGIFENSRYARLMYHFDAPRTFELISGYGVGRMRKTRFVSSDDAFDKLAKWVKSVPVPPA